MKNNTFDKILNTFGVLLGAGIVIFILMTLTSCSISSFAACDTFAKEKEKELEYKIDKLYLEYSYKRDSLIIEHNKNK